nr:hypothetical protein [Tanacetum cinerariifolium]
MATTINQQVALDESLVPSTQRLRIGRSDFRLPSDIQSKESTLQVVYDVLRNSPLFRAFQVTADVPEIYMQEFWATAKLHHTSIHYKIDTKKSVEQKNQKRSNEMYYPRFTKVIIDYFMTRKPSISRRNRINWHYVRDDVLFSTIKVVSRHQTTQQYGAILPIELTTDEIKNSKVYKEYYACAMREAAPKPKASARKKKGKQPARAITPTEPTDVQRTEAEQLKIALKRSRQETHISQQRGSDTDEGTSSKPVVPDVPSDDSEEELSWNSSDDNILETKQTPLPSEVLQNLPTFDLVFRFEDRLKSLKANFSEYIQTNPFAEAVSNILGIVHQYMNQQVTEAVRVAVQIQTNQLHDSYQRENDEFLRTIDENIKRIIKELVKSQVKEQVS